MNLKKLDEKLELLLKLSVMLLFSGILVAGLRFLYLNWDRMIL